MADNLHQLHQWAQTAVAGARDGQELYVIKTELLGKSGKITELMKQIGQMPPDERKEFGARINEVKGAIESLLHQRQGVLDAANLANQLQSEFVDLTMPTGEGGYGALHPVSQTIEEIITIFGNMGFHYADGPQIETDWFNFTALNIPPSHPARQMQDTFYVDKYDADGNPFVLRTHTSPVQIRGSLALGKNGTEPVRIIAPGRTYRSDSDITHTPMFHQVEGIVIEKNIHFGHLKGCLQDFCADYFEVAGVPLRFRPSYFPFTEPSAEVDIGCSRKDGNLRIGAGDSWLEILGSGMVHPKVLRNAGYDPNQWQGFAFGMGIERIAMLKYGIPDLRDFFHGDNAWLNHYGFKPWQNPCLLRSLVA